MISRACILGLLLGRVPPLENSDPRCWWVKKVDHIFSRRDRAFIAEADTQMQASGRACMSSGWRMRFRAADLRLYLCWPVPQGDAHEAGSADQPSIDASRQFDKISEVPPPLPPFPPPTRTHTRTRAHCARSGQVIGVRLSQRSRDEPLVAVVQVTEPAGLSLQGPYLSWMEDAHSSYLSDWVLVGRGGWMRTCSLQRSGGPTAAARRQWRRRPPAGTPPTPRTAPPPCRGAPPPRRPPPHPPRCRCCWWRCHPRGGCFLRRVPRKDVGSRQSTGQAQLFPVNCRVRRPAAFFDSIWRSCSDCCHLDSAACWRSSLDG